MNLFGLCGVAGSGKDTAAGFLVKQGFVKVSFADPMKRFCGDVFGFSYEQLWGTSSKRNEPDPRYVQIRAGAGGMTILPNGETILAPREDVCLTPRYALQQLGTEWGRKCYRNIWAEYAVRVAKTLLETTYEDSSQKGYHPLYYSEEEGLWQGHNPRQVVGVVISDVRFSNELHVLRQAGGKVFRLLRGQGLEGAAGQHSSEQELQNIPLEEFDGVIDNREWSLAQLEEHMKKLVEGT